MTGFTADEQWAFDFLKARGVDPSWDAMQALIAARTIYESATPEQCEQALAALVNSRAWLQMPVTSGGQITIQRRAGASHVDRVQIASRTLDENPKYPSVSPGKSAKVLRTRARNKAARKARKKGRS